MVGRVIAPDLLSRLGEALYGPRWQGALARDLGVSDRTIRRWLDGSRRVGEAEWQRALRLARMRQRQLGMVIAELGDDYDDGVA